MPNIATAPSLSQPSRSPRQTQALEKGCKNSVPGLGSRVPPRSDLTYVRPGAHRTRPELGAPKLLEAILWMHTRRGREWDDLEADTMAELRARTWGEVQCRSAATHHLPSWFLSTLPGRIAYGCALFCYFVLASHRAGALGVLASYTELAALCGVSERTAARWCKKMEGIGFLEVVQTWQRNPNRGRKRGFWKHLYRPGPAMREIAGMGMLEGAKGLSEAAANFARRCARVARARLRGRQRTRSDELWRARNGRRCAQDLRADTIEKQRVPTPEPAKCAPLPPSLSLDMLATPSPPPGGRGIGAPSSLRGTGVAAAPPHEEERPPAVSVPVTPAANATPRAVHRPAQDHPGRGPKGRARPVPVRGLRIEDSRSPGPEVAPRKPSSQVAELFAGWVDAQTQPSRETHPLKCAAAPPDAEDPYAAERKAFVEAKRRRRLKKFDSS